MRARRRTALVGDLVVADCKTYGQADSDITARPDEQFVIELGSNPTTGHEELTDTVTVA